MNMLKKREDGLVSIVIVMMIIIILTLMTIGFTKIMDRSFRQSIDRELATQASYAAEAGLNDARAYVLAATQNGDAIDTNGDCMDLSNPPAGSPFAKNGSISGTYSGNPTDDTLVRYTCVIIDPKPNDLVYEVDAGKSRVFKTYTDPGQTINRLFFSWTNVNQEANSLTLPSPYELPQESFFDDTTGGNSRRTGILRVTIYPIQNSLNSYVGDRNARLNDLARTYFLYPNGSVSQTPGSVSYSAANTNGSFIPGNCSAANLTTNPNPNPIPNEQAPARFCNSYVSNLSNSGADFYYIRITALYRDLDVTIQAGGGTTPADNNSLNLLGAETVIDVTGQGNDVLKRLQGRVTHDAEFDLPQYAIQSMDTLCKRFRLPKTGASTYGDAVMDDNGSAVAQGDGAACKP